ncbi:MAG: alpha/beta hydrolase [Actinomycetota bacterium]
MTKVFVHGNPETAAIWGPLVDALVAGGLEDEVVTVSPPGFGAPSPEGWDPTPASYVAWLGERLEAIDGPIDLVGHDWGAGHVYGLLSAAPELIRSWAADCAGLLHPDYVWHDMAQVWQTPDAGEEAVAAMTALGAEARQEAYEGLGLPAEIAASMALAADEEMGRCVLGLYRGARQPARAELGRELSDAALPPGLVLDATDDPYVASELGARMVSRLEASHLRLEGLSHWWMTEDPTAAVEGLLGFWSGLDAGTNGGGS